MKESLEREMREGIDRIEKAIESEEGGSDVSSH